jgi:hypothetical protein
VVFNDSFFLLIDSGSRKWKKKGALEALPFHHFEKAKKKTMGLS